MNKVISRAKAILLDPKATWEVVKSEPATVAQIYKEYLFLLAAVPAVARFIGLSLIGFSGAFLTFRVPIRHSLPAAVLSYALTLAGVFLVATVIDALAPTFGATKNALNAFKVAAYSCTPTFVAGILYIFPSLAPVVMLAGLYGIYLLYLGLQSLMACPADKVVGYTIVSILVMVGVFLVVGLIIGQVLGFGYGYGFGGGLRAGWNVPARNVSIGDLTVETGEGKATFSAGADVRVPDNFPSDVYVYARAKVQSAATVPNGWHLVLQTKDAADTVLGNVKAKMTGNGWEEVMSLSHAGGNFVLSYKKADRTATITVSPGSDKMTQIFVTATKE